MKCPVCGFTEEGEASGGVCPRCSLQQALAGAVMSGAFEGAGAGTTASTAPAVPIPGYELLRPIGHGAMGAVWLARDERLDRLVALKLIPHGGDSVLAERLLREGRAAARLSHPNLVPVHALGGSGSSTYLAMEFQEGGSLADRWQDAPQPPRQMAALGAKLAAALAHAHAAGILHRDLKPSNVLLGADGEPRLGDFGLASPLDGRGDLTRTGEFGGTPAYVAPELLEGADRASPLSDLYALSVLLYVGLTGRPPFRADSTPALLREIAESVPPDPRVFQAGIPRDLETIVLKGLEKVPAHRYDSAEALRDDLSRFLAGEPIRARPVSQAEKLIRWCRRRPAAAAALILGALVVLLLAVGGPLVAWKLDRSRRAADEAAATATAISNFLRTDLLAQASPDNQPNRDLKLRTVLDQASAKVESRFANRPEVEAAIRQTLGETYFALGELTAARSHYERALQLRLPGGGPPLTQDSRATLNALGSALFFQGHLDEAAAAFRRVAESGAVPTKGDPTVVQALGNWGIVAQKAGRQAEGTALTERAWKLSQQLNGPEAPETLTLTNNVIGNAMSDGDYARAARLEAEVLAVRTRVSGPDHPDTATVMANLALILRQLNRLPEAEDYDRKVLAVRQRVSGPDHIFTLIALGDLAQTLKAENRLSEAEATARSAAEGAKRTLGAVHPQTVQLIGQWGEILILQHRSREAEAALEPIWEARPKTWAEDWKYDLFESRWGEALAEMGRESEGRAALKEAVAGLVRTSARIPRWNQAEIGVAEARLARWVGSNP